jgi:DNA-binding GntR family transcriptional regulator
MSGNLQEQLYQRLRADLLAGRYLPGQRLKIRDLAAAWGTSPMPVRAALQRLAAEGALEGEAQRSLHVPQMDGERYRHLLQVRLSLEGLAAEEGARRMDADTLQQLQQASQAMQAALDQRDVQAYLQHNSQFHLGLYRAAGNPLLLRLIESLWLQVGPFFNQRFTAADLSLRLNEFHQQCLQAILAGDALAARASIERDLSFCGQALLNLLALDSQPAS